MNSHHTDFPSYRSLGRALQHIEEWLSVETERLQEGGSKYAFPGGFLELSDMWVTLDYVLNEKDPAYDESNDNFLYSFRRPLPLVGSLLDDLMTSSILEPEGISRIGGFFVDLVYVGKYSSDRLTHPSDNKKRTAVTTLIWNPKDRYCACPRFCVNNFLPSLKALPLEGAR